MPQLSQEMMLRCRRSPILFHSLHYALLTPPAVHADIQRRSASVTMPPHWLGAMLPGATSRTAQRRAFEFQNIAAGFSAVVGELSVAGARTWQAGVAARPARCPLYARCRRRARHTPPRAAYAIKRRYISSKRSRADSRQFSGRFISYNIISHAPLAGYHDVDFLADYWMSISLNTNAIVDLGAY